MAKKKKVQAAAWEDDPPETPAVPADGAEGGGDAPAAEIEPDWAPADKKSKKKK